MAPGRVTDPADRRAARDHPERREGGDGPLQGRPHHRGGVLRDRVPGVRRTGRVRVHGHREHDELHRGDARAVASRLRDPARRSTPTGPTCAAPAAAASSSWCARASVPGQCWAQASLENAVRVTLALGGSTNATLHLPAIAARSRAQTITPDTFDVLGRTTPLIGTLRARRPPDRRRSAHGGRHPGCPRRASRRCSTGTRRRSTAARSARSARRRRSCATTCSHPLGCPDRTAGRHRRAARQPGPARRGGQAERGRARHAPSHRARRASSSRRRRCATR